MSPLPQFQELSVISDLHMGGEKRDGKNFQIFKQGDVLGKLITGLANKKNGKIGLVINGDMVDFLAEPNPKYFDPDGAIAKLDRIADDASFKPVWMALKNFVAQSDRRAKRRLSPAIHLLYSQMQPRKRTSRSRPCSGPRLFPHRSLHLR